MFTIFVIILEVSSDHVCRVVSVLKALLFAFAGIVYNLTETYAFHAAGEGRRQVKNVTNLFKNVNIVEFHDHI